MRNGKTGMCRGGKDGRIKRCKVKDTQRATANLRKKIKYRADKEEMTVEEWKKNNPETVAALMKHALPVSGSVMYQPDHETRRLPEAIPAYVAEHVKLTKENN
jgi:hypothetical protein